MEPLSLLCNLKCPESGAKAYVGIEVLKEEGCRVTSCTLWAFDSKPCSWECLEGTVSGLECPPSP